MKWLLVALLVFFALDIAGRLLPYSPPSPLARFIIGLLSLASFTMILVALVRGWKLP